MLTQEGSFRSHLTKELRLHVIEDLVQAVNISVAVKSRIFCLLDIDGIIARDLCYRIRNTRHVFLISSGKLLSF